MHRYCADNLGKYEQCQNVTHTHMERYHPDFLELLCSVNYDVMLLVMTRKPII